MKGRIIYFYLFICLCLTGLTTRTNAQTITTNALSVSAVCVGSGGNLSVPFSTTGVYVIGNVFTAQLSDANGAFSGTVTTIGTLLLAPSSPTTASISAILPKSLTTSANYKIRIISSIPSRTSTNTQSLVVQALPSLPSISTPDPYCKGDIAKPLTATASAGGILNWYGDNASGTPTATASTPNTNIVGTTPYYVSQTLNGCTSAQASIQVVVKDRPNAPGTSSKPYCVGEVASALSATPVSGATLNWYGGPVGGTASSVAPTPSTTSAGSIAYYVSQTLNGCESSRASLIVTVSSGPEAPKVTNPAPVCVGATAAPLSATATTGGTLRWWGTNASGGTFSTTPTVPGSQATATYYVSQVVGNCESPRAPIVVTVNQALAAPTLISSLTYCQNETAKPLSATATTGGTLNWYGTNATGGVASTTPNTPATSTPGTVVYYVSQTIGSCESPRASISILTRPTPAAPGTTSPVIFCQGRPANALTAVPTQGALLNWYGTNATGGTASSTAPVPSTSTVGSTIYYVSQSLNGCEGPRASLTVTVNPLPTKPTVTAAGPYCKSTQASSLSASGQNLLWYGTNQNGGASSTVATVPATSAVGTTNYYVTQTINGCESDRAAIPVTVKDTPTAPGTSPIEFCQNSPVPTLTASFATNATANWYGTNATGGSASQTPPVLSANPAPGQTTYYVGQTVDGCSSPRASLVVTVKALPSAPGVSAISYCNNAQAQPLAASGTNIKWYDASDKSLGGTPTPVTSSVGDQTFKATQTVNGCESNKATLLVTIKPIPAAPGVSNLTYCQAQVDQPAQNIPALTASGQDLRWYNADGNAYQSAPTPPISQTGTFSFLVTQTVNSCESTKATLQVLVRTTPAPTVSKPVVSYCVDEKSVPLEATGETGSALRWIDPYGHETITSPTPPTINVNVDPKGDAYYVYQISSSGCYSARSMIRVIVNSIPTLSLTGSATVNLGQKTPLRLKFTGNPPFSYTLTGGYSGIANTADTTISVLPRGTTTYQVNGVTNSCGVGLPGNPATAVVTVLAPTIATGAISSNTLCAGTSVVVPFTTTGTFTSGNIFRAEVISVTDTTKKYELTATSTSSPITATLSSTLASGQYYVRVKGSNPDVGVVGTNSPTQLTVRSKPTATLTGTQTINEGIPGSLTIAFGGEGPWTVIYADSVRSYSATTTTNPYIAEVRPARTTTYRLTTVSNTCGLGTTSGTAIVSVQTVLGVEDNLLDPLVRVYPIPTGNTLTVAIDVSLTRDPAVLSLTDQQGRPIRQLTTRARQTELDMSSQPTGLYFLRIQIGDRQSVRKVLKQ